MNAITHNLDWHRQVTIKRLGDSKRDFVISGLPTNPDWIRIGEVADQHWCNISLAGGVFGGITVEKGHVNPEPWVSGFGGAVWPGAWPELFTPPPRNNYACGPNHLTPLALELFTQAAEL